MSDGHNFLSAKQTVGPHIGPITFTGRCSVLGSVSGAGEEAQSRGGGGYEMVQVRVCMTVIHVLEPQPPS